MQEAQACNGHLQAELVLHSDAHTAATGDVPDDIAHRLDELDTERSELENELELVRRRAVELSESLENSERGFDLERQRLAEEVNQLRQAMQEQAETIAKQQVTHVSEKKDPVLGNVMAQFALLQQQNK